MGNKIILLTLLIILFTLHSISEETLPKYFGKDKEQSKKCLLISTNNISSDLAAILEKISAKEGVAEENYINQTIRKLNIGFTKISPSSFFERDTVNIELFLGDPGPGDGLVDTFKDYGIIIVAGHGGYGGSLVIENYMDLSYQKGEDDWWEYNWMPSSISQQKESDAFKENKTKYKNKYGEDNITSAFVTFRAPKRDFDTGEIIKDSNGKIIYEEIEYAHTIGITPGLLEQELPDLSGVLVIISSCVGSWRTEEGTNLKSFKDIFLAKGASVVVASPVETTTAATEDFLKIMSGQGYARVNYSTDEIQTNQGNVINPMQIYPENAGRYVLYRQPHIDSIIVKSLDENDNENPEILYQYEYSEKNEFNSEKKYPGIEELKNAWKKAFLEKSKLKFYIDFSEPVDLTQPTEFLKDSFDTESYLFRLYRFSSPNLSDGLKKGDDYIDAKVLKTGKSILSTELVFDLKQLKKQNMDRLIFVAKVPDYYNADGMFYLDTIGMGREDQLGRCGFKTSYMNVPDKNNCCETVQAIYGNKENDGLDTNHYFAKPIQLVVKDCEIGKLHLPLIRFAPPPRIANMQPLTLDGRIETPDWFWSRLSQCRSEKNPAYCEQYFTGLILEDTIHPVYYLSKPLILQQVVDWLAVLDTSFITKLFQPAYVAELKADTELKPYVLDGSIYDYVKLYLDIQPFEPSTKKYGNNTPSGNRINYEIPKELFRVYYYTEEPYKTEGCVLLPLFYLYLVNNSLSDSLPDGAHTLRIETSLKSDEDMENEGYASLLTLKYIKDFQQGDSTENLGNTSASVIRDAASGFSNRLLNYWIGNWFLKIEDAISAMDNTPMNG